MRARIPIQRLWNDERGFSLIEMLAALSILLTIVGILTTLMVSATKSEVDLTERVKAQQEARLALEGMRRDVHCASAVTFTSAASVTLTLSTGCPSASGGTAFTWCTNPVAGSSDRFTLHRVTAATCDLVTPTVVRRQTADYLKQSDVFLVKKEVDKLDKLCVVFAVDTDPADARRTYQLKDELVMRNSARNTAATANTATC
jgi:prepilin-type N-terminal cleavage/methylation domain-containing protein